MDGNTGKSTTGELDIPISSCLSSRDPNHEESSFQFHSRIGCSRRHNPMKNARNNNSEISRNLKTPFRCNRSYSSAASSSKSFPSTCCFQKCYHEPSNLASVKDKHVAESNTWQEDTEADVKWDLGLHGREEDIEALELHETANVRGFSLSATEAPSSSNAASASRYDKQINQRFMSACQDTESSFLRRSSKQRSAARVSKTISQGISSRPQRSGLINIGCASISDVLRSGCSFSTGHHKREVSARRKLQVGEGSSNTLCLPEHEVPHEASRRTRIQSGRDVGSDRTRQGFSGGESSRMRLSEQEYEHIVPSSISDVSEEKSLRSFSVDRPSAFLDFSFAGRPGSSNRHSQNRLISADRDDYQRFNMEGIAEVLVALERIGQDEDLTYEQLMVLEANLVLGGFSFYDQHRDMRLDIDDMSYEELLALEEKMGTVSTALSEDAFSKCLKRSIYSPSFAFLRIPRLGDGDVKCSICQEEYVIGEEVGRLPCDHLHHVECIHQWLRLKNWCPICKAPAAFSKNVPRSY